MKQKISLCFRVVAVGGDGIYNEVVSGLTVRELRDHGQDPDNPECKLTQLKLPIGIIPAGKDIVFQDILSLFESQAIKSNVPGNITLFVNTANYIQAQSYEEILTEILV